MAPDRQASGGRPGSSTRCKATITVVKRLVPSTDPGKFDLKIDGDAKVSAVGDGGTTDSVAVDAGSHTVSEAGADGTQLGDYKTSIRCTGGTSEISRDGHLDRRGRGARRCRHLPDHEPGARSSQSRRVSCPMLECVLFNDGQPDVAYWGYNEHEQRTRCRSRVATGTTFSSG